MFLCRPDDDPNFLVLARDVIRGSLESHPQRVSLVRIDNWFDSNWLGFAGKTLGALGVSFRKDLRLPPFHPNRVTGQFDYFWNATKQEDARVTVPSLHLHQKSSENFQRRVLSELKLESARLVWYSGNSLANQRGSLMVYDFRADAEHPWYVELRAGHPWQIHRCRGISPAELMAFQLTQSPQDFVSG